MPRRRTRAPDDPLLHRARRASAEARKLLASSGQGCGGAQAEPPEPPAPRAVLATMAELALVLRELLAERSRLGAELETIDRQTRAVSAYRAAGALHALPPRAKRF
ncbi:hypothetical protein [Rhodoplanes roseus]|uniref:Uncharacterized protein n=1 Tax=Rhodoplanes roseus TaxID=29409 RepID=A0A327KNT2_9BRAD|nr:hypothetical protein [Rhodoplanes roseus]RAI40550.1 hypothetical protein CH341_23550 [Rhodoplanes roseus]